MITEELRRSRTISTLGNKKAIRAEYGLTGTINSIQENDTPGKYREMPIGYREQAEKTSSQSGTTREREIRTTMSMENIATKKKDGTDCLGMCETMNRWEEWAKERIVNGEKRSFRQNRTHT